MKRDMSKKTFVMIFYVVFLLITGSINVPFIYGISALLAIYCCIVLTQLETGVRRKIAVLINVIFLCVFLSFLFNLWKYESTDYGRSFGGTGFIPGPGFGFEIDQVFYYFIILIPYAIVLLVFYIPPMIKQYLEARRNKAYLKVANGIAHEFDESRKSQTHNDHITDRDDKPSATLCE